MGENYREIIAQIQSESSNEPPLEATDENLMASISNQRQDPEYNERNHAYTELLRSYIKDYEQKAKHKKRFKSIFFWIIMIVFAGISGIAIVSTFMVLKHGNVTLEEVGVVISAFASAISAFIIIPKIIAEHLFPANEDENMIEMVKSMQENDARIRAHLHGAKGIEQDEAAD